VKRSFDAGDINPILNDPAVFPLVSLPGMEAIDVAPQIADPRNVLLVAPGAGLIFFQTEPCYYEVHTNFLKPNRAAQSANGAGPYIRNVCLDAYRWMFTHTDCLEIVTRIPAHNRAASVFAPLVGWTKEFERHGVWPTLEHGHVDMAFFSLRYDDWVRKTPGLMESGRWFHQRMAAECARLGHSEERHAEEDCHDLHVGACVETIFGGQLDKAIILYNKWARFAGYGLIALVSKSPLLIDIGDALLHLADNDFKVVKCRSPQG
jgi:hypothetical protein